MIKPIRSILFATDLTPNCQPALDFTIAVATRFQATIYMLHVIEKLPEHLSGRLKGLLGTHQWENMVHSHEMNAHKSLLGKQSTSSGIREAVNNFCKLEGLDDTSCDFKSSEIIISDGELIEEILSNAEKNKCDLIVLGGHKNVFSRTALGGTAKGVLKKSKIAVTVVPSVVSWGGSLGTKESPGSCRLSRGENGDTAVGTSMDDKNIKLYAVSTCGHCKTLKKMLETERLVFDSVDVDLLAGAERREMLAEVKQVNKRCSFPTMVIGEKVIVGFRENEIKEALGIR